MNRGLFYVIASSLRSLGVLGVLGVSAVRFELRKIHRGGAEYAETTQRISQLKISVAYIVGWSGATGGCEVLLSDAKESERAAKLP